MSYRFAVSRPVWHILLLCAQWKTADDGQTNCPKHVEFFSKNKFEKLVYLVCFTIWVNGFFITITYLLTYLLTPCSRVLLEKLANLQLVKKFPAFYGTRKFLTALTSSRHPSLSRASPIQFSYPNPTSWRSIIILSSHLRLGLPSGLFPSGFPTSTLYTPLPSPYGPHAPPTSFLYNN